MSSVLVCPILAEEKQENCGVWVDEVVGKSISQVHRK